MKHTTSTRNTRRPMSMLALGCALAIGAGTPPAHAADVFIVPAADTTDIAIKRYDKGLTLFHAGEHDQALAAFQEAWAMSKHYQIASALGVCELELGKHRDAAEHLHDALENIPDDAAAEERSGIQEAFDRAAKQVVQLSIEVTPASQTLTVNGKVVQPNTAGFYEPGPLTIVATADGHVSTEKVKTFAAGVKGTMSLTLTKEITVKPSPPSSGPDARLVAGVGFAYGACAGLSIGLSGSILGEDLNGMTIAGYATAGGLAAVSTGLLLWWGLDDGKDGEPSETAFVAPMIGKEQVGLNVLGTW